MLVANIYLPYGCSYIVLSIILGIYIGFSFSSVGFVTI